MKNEKEFYMKKKEPLIEGDKVFVYFNLHKKTFSVKNLSTGIVVAYLDNVNLKDAIFKVSQKGRERVLQEKRKNVHAGVVGVFTYEEFNQSLTKQAKYNPYKYESFVDSETKEKVESSKTVSLLNKKESKPCILYEE